MFVKHGAICRNKRDHENKNGINNIKECPNNDNKDQ